MPSAFLSIQARLDVHALNRRPALASATVLRPKCSGPSGNLQKILHSIFMIGAHIK